MLKCLFDSEWARTPVTGSHTMIGAFWQGCQVVDTQCKPSTTGMSCPRQWHRTGSRWSPVRTLLVAPLWGDLGSSQTVVVIKLRRTSAYYASRGGRFKLTRLRSCAEGIWSIRRAAQNFGELFTKPLIFETHFLLTRYSPRKSVGVVCDTLF